MTKTGKYSIVNKMEAKCNKLTSGVFSLRRNGFDYHRSMLVGGIGSALEKVA